MRLDRERRRRHGRRARAAEVPPASQPSPWRVDRTVGGALSPLDADDRHRRARCAAAIPTFSASEPKRASALAASTASKGKARAPACAPSRARSARRRPRRNRCRRNPPATSTPVQPSSAHSRQNAREKPSPAASARNLRKAEIGRARGDRAARALHQHPLVFGSRPACRPHSAGSSSRRLATMSSMISDVPPSIELPFERSQSCATSWAGPPLPSK